MPMRYAIYYAPERDTALWQLASAWLGRDAADNTVRSHPVVPGLSEPEIARITARPRRYGFHATLKAPFTLRNGTTEDELRYALSGFARRRQRFDIPLSVDRVSNFLALTSREPCAELDDLAAACVKEFEPFRAPLSSAEMERKLKSDLNPRQQALLKRWGYPYVMEEFRFHMTLTSTLPEADLLRTLPRLEHLLEPGISEPVAVNAVALFTQADENSNFVISERFRFNA